jgi:hypothetical protein
MIIKKKLRFGCGHSGSNLNIGLTETLNLMANGNLDEEKNEKQLYDEK